MIDLKAIKERYEAVKEAPRGPYKVTLIDSITYQGKHHGRPLAQMVKGDLTQKTITGLATLFAHARQDLPDCVEYIERLQRAVEASKMCSIPGDGPCPHGTRECVDCEEYAYPCDVAKALEGK